MQTNGKAPHQYEPESLISSKQPHLDNCTLNNQNTIQNGGYMYSGGSAHVLTAANCTTDERCDTNSMKQLSETVAKSPVSIIDETKKTRSKIKTQRMKKQLNLQGRRLRKPLQDNALLQNYFEWDKTKKSSELTKYKVVQPNLQPNDMLDQDQMATETTSNLTTATNYTAVGDEDHRNAQYSFGGSMATETETNQNLNCRKVHPVVFKQIVTSEKVHVSNQSTRRHSIQSSDTQGSTESFKTVNHNTLHSNSSSDGVVFNEHQPFCDHFQNWMESVNHTGGECALEPFNDLNTTIPSTPLFLPDYPIGNNSHLTGPNGIFVSSLMSAFFSTQPSKPRFKRS